MNILIDLLPTEVGGFLIYSDFRTMILFSQLMQETDTLEQEQMGLARRLFYVDASPEDDDQAMQLLLWFFRCGKPAKQTQPVGRSTPYMRSYCYEQDAELIYSAFLSQYGIDLQDVECLHWWKFQALFDGLEEHHKIMKVISYRLTDISQLPKNQQGFYRQMKELYKIHSQNEPAKLSLEERNQSMHNYVKKRFDTIYHW